jgi:hypothetical protein
MTTIEIIKVVLLTIVGIIVLFLVCVTTALFLTKNSDEQEDLYDPQDDFKSSEKPFMSSIDIEREIKGTTKILSDDIKKRDLIIKRQKSIL